jgi:hypothetical protein
VFQNSEKAIIKIMKQEEITKSKFFRIFIPIIIVCGVISIFKAGYATGQWLFTITH